jgi:hypothetical protein
MEPPRRTEKRLLLAHVSSSALKTEATRSSETSPPTTICFSFLPTARLATLSRFKS